MDIRSIEELLPLTWLEHYILERYKIYDLLKNKRVLDIGCGTGFFTHAIAKYASEVIGIDVCENNIKFANSKNKDSNMKFLTMDASNMNFKDKFDAIFCSEIIEHVRDKQSLFKNIIRLLKTNGILIMAVTIKPKRTAFMYKAHEYFDRVYDKNAPEVHKGGMYAPVYAIDFNLTNNGFTKIFSMKYRSPFLFSLEIMITLLERMGRGNKRVEGFADNADMLGTNIVKSYISMLPLIKFLARADFLLKFIDTTNEILVYKK